MLEFWTERYLTARKQHTCQLCGEHIEEGERYLRASGKYDGEFYDSCFHCDCNYIIERYCRDTGEAEWDTDAIWEWLNDRYCRDCAHSAYEDDDCEFNVLTCPVIKRKMKEGDGDD